MSQKYEWLYNTTYPDKIQEFEEKLNITPNDATLIKQVQQLIEQRKFAEANAIRQQIPNYKQKQIIAQDFNTVFDTTVALQLEYDSRYTPSYVLSKEKPTNQSEGDYWYRITNIKYFGETEEIGTGEKSPDNPYILKGLEVPDTEITLYSLPSGVCDEYNVQTSALTKRIGKIILNGSETNWSINEPWDTQYPSIIHVNTYLPNWKIGQKNAICSNLIFTTEDDKDFNKVCAMCHTTNDGFGVFAPAQNTDVTDFSARLSYFKQWLSQNPVTVLYELSTPEIIQL